MLPAIFSLFSTSTTATELSSPVFLSPANCYGVPASQLPITRNCGVPAIKLLAAPKKTTLPLVLSTKFLLSQKNVEEKGGIHKYPSFLYLPLFPFTLMDSVSQPFFPRPLQIRCNCCYKWISTSGPLDKHGVTITWP